MKIKYAVPEWVLLVWIAYLIPSLLSSPGRLCNGRWAYFGPELLSSLLLVSSNCTSMVAVATLVHIRLSLPTLETPSAPFLDLTVLSDSSVYANFSAPLSDGGAAINSYKVSIQHYMQFFAFFTFPWLNYVYQFTSFRSNGILILECKRCKRLLPAPIPAPMRFNPSPPVPPRVMKSRQ